jgi:hypothetical protein
MAVPKKIKILEGIRQGKIGGGESYLLSLVENLDRSTFEPVVVSFTDGPMVERLRSLGITTHIIYTEKPFDFRVWKRVQKLIETKRSTSCMRMVPAPIPTCSGPQKKWPGH